MKKRLTQEEIEKMDLIIKDHYNKNNNKETSWTVYDGLFDLNFYNRAQFKILWVLKEVYEVSEMPDFADVGDWDYRKELMPKIRDGNNIRKGWRKTFQPIVLASYGILNDSLWDDMDNIEDDPSMIDIIKSIGFINIKKQPGGPRSKDSELKEAYHKDKLVIHDQMDKFDPDIIICGGTLKDYLVKGLGLKEENAVQVSGLKCYIQNDKIYIRAYHPSFYGIGQEEYVDGIINAVRFWINSKKV